MLVVNMYINTIETFSCAVKHLQVGYQNSTILVPNKMFRFVLNRSTF